MSLGQNIEGEVREVLKANTVEEAEKVVRSRQAGPLAIGTISFLEAVLPLPILTDPFLVAAVLLDRKRIHSLVVVTVITSVLGGAAAYLMAVYLFDLLMSVLSVEMVIQFNTMVNENTSGTFMLTLVGAVTPVPYTIVAWVVAVLKGNFLAFVAASTVGRAFRYGVVGYATYYFGPTAITYVKKYLGVTSIIILLAAATYFFLR